MSRSKAHAQTPSPASRLRQAAVALAVMVMVHCLFFAAVLFQGGSYVSPDTIQAAAPAQVYTSQFRAQFHTSPRWIPHVFSGMPARGSLMVLPQYPAHLPFRLLLGEAYDADVAKVVHHLLASVWTWLVVRSWGGSHAAGVMAGLCFSLATSLVSVTSADHGGKLYAASYLPLVVLVATWLVRGPGWVVVAVGSAVAGLMLLAAHPQIAYYGFVALGIAVACGLPRVVRERGWRGAVVVVGSTIAMGVLGYLVSTPLSLPAQEYAPESIRGAGPSGGLDYGYATQWSLHPAELGTYLVPSLFGYGGTTYWGHMPFTDAPHYLGVFVLALAGMGLAVRWRTWRGVFLVVMAAFAVLVALGKYSPGVYQLAFSLLPQFNRFRVPVLIMVLFQLAVCLAAAFGLDSWRRFGKGWWAVGAMVVVVGLLGSHAGARASRAGEERLDVRTRQALAQERAGMAREDTIRSCLFFILPGVAISLGRRRGWQGSIPWVVCAVVVADLWGVSARVAKPQHRKGDPQRLLAPTEGERWLARQPGWFRILPVDERSNSNRFMALNLESALGYYPAKLSRYATLLESGAISSPSVLRMLGVRYVLSARPLQTTLPRVAAFGRETVYLLPDPLPKAWGVAAWEVVTRNEAFQRIAEPTFAPESLAFLETDPGIPQGGEVRVTRVERTRPDRLVLEVEVVRDAVVVISEVYYRPGWKAKVDGRHTPVLAANGVLCAVVVPAGAETVEFFYSSRAEELAGWFQWLGWSGVVGVGVVGVARGEGGAARWIRALAKRVRPVGRTRGT